MQLIIRNLETDDDWIYPVDEMWPIVPRIGETFSYIALDKDGNEDDKQSFSGVVEDIMWYADYRDFSVFICVRPPNNLI